MITPLHDIVLVRRIEEEEGLIITQDKEPSGKGEVVAVGKGVTMDDGKIIPLDVQVGDVVLFGKMTGMDSGYEDLVAMRENDIMGIIYE